MRIGDMRDGDVVCAEDRFFFHRGGQLQNEFGVLIYPQDWDSEGQLVMPRVIRAATDYSCISRWAELPRRRLLFKDGDNYRYAVELRDWRLEIPFQFRTTDDRAPWGNACFRSSSGRVAKLLVTAAVFSFDIDRAGAVTCLLNQQCRVTSGQ